MPQALIDIKNDEALSEIRDLAGIDIWRPYQ
jgi:hypothetical protein